MGENTMRPLQRLVPLLCLALFFWCTGACEPTAPTEPKTENTPELPPNETPTKEPPSERPSQREAQSDQPLTDGGPKPTEESQKETPPQELTQEFPQEPVTNDAAPPERPKESTPDTQGGTCPSSNASRKWGNDTVTVTCTPEADGRRAYTLATTHGLRDNDPASKQVQYTEQPDQPKLRSGDLLLDALFALALDEVKKTSVSQIQEGAFNNNQPVSCVCFQTGKKWTWAWTRDSAYAIDLGLGLLDPIRAMNTLQFKLSSGKAGKKVSRSPQIVQDTGTGGSWPVSSDRVVWAIGAWKLLRTLPQGPDQSFATTMYNALYQTIQQDRVSVFDPSDGLYRGEQSFLDWREQSYPSWSKENIQTIAMSKTLSTNVGHLVAIQSAAALAKWLKKPQEAQTLDTWATSLKAAIATGFALQGTPLLSTMKTHTLASFPIQRYDLLGLSLAILFGVVDAKQGQAILSTYPHSPVGPPVQWPQQPLTAIYHNRAIWPFVTAYWLRAASRIQHATAFSHNLRSLLQGAALNLSNMENFEWTTLANWYQDGSHSGPVINSRYQLWSVAGFVSGIVESLFGLQTKRDDTSFSLRFQPFIPQDLRQDWLKKTTLTLEGLPYRGKTLDITLLVPQSASQQPLVAGQVTLNGAALSSADAWIEEGKLKAHNQLTITLIAKSQGASDSITVVKDTGDFRALWSPKEPSIKAIREVNGKLQLTIDSLGETGTEHTVYRDGVVIATKVKAGTWTDTAFTQAATASPCYTITASFTSSGNTSHISQPRCWQGTNNQRQQTLDAWRFEAIGGKWSLRGSEGTYESWGGLQDKLQVHAFRPHWTGTYRLQLRYRNPSGSTSTGITCATKRVRFFDRSNNQEVAQMMVVMPQTGQLASGHSTIHTLALRADKTYSILIDDPTDLVNMSSLDHFSSYNGGKGGSTERWNQAELLSIELAPASGQDQTPQTGKLVSFDGSNDLNKIPTKQHLTPSIQLATWEKFGWSWDADWLYIAVVSKGFEQPLRAFMLYVESINSTSTAATPSTGMTYLNLTPQLPFAPTHLIGLRERTDNNDGFGPWNGVWRKESAGWVLQTRWKPGRDSFVAQDKHTISVRIRRTELGQATKLRIVGHLVHGGAGNEWKVTLPSTHTPWKSHTTGYIELDLGQAPGPAAWQTK